MIVDGTMTMIMIMIMIMIAIINCMLQRANLHEDHLVEVPVLYMGLGLQQDTWQGGPSRRLAAALHSICKHSMRYRFLIAALEQQSRAASGYRGSRYNA